MNFFKSVFSDDPDPPSSSSDPETLISSEQQHSLDPQSPIESTPKPPFSAVTGGWTFGNLIETISSRSETVLETYRRDLQEFTSGLKSETEVLKHVATSSLDISAAKAQVSLESVGRAVDVVWKSTADIISHGKESLLAHDLDSSEYSPRLLSRDHSVGNLSNSGTGTGSSNVRYNRFEAQLRAIQSDVNSYVEEVEDGKEEFERWRVGFDLREWEEEVERLMGESGGVVEGIYREVVPSVVDRETFWLRYFYRVHRLKQAEFVRAKLLEKRSMEGEDEDEELSWDVDDDDDDGGDEKDGKVKDGVGVADVKGLASDVANVALKGEEEARVEGDNAGEEGDVVEAAREVKGSTNNVANVALKEEEEARVEGEKGDVVEPVKEGVSKEVVEKEEEKKMEKKGEEEEEEMEEKVEASESGKDSDISIVSSQPSHDEEDLGWDEIGDVGSGDEKHGTQLGSPEDRAELRKRLSATEDDEDLTWDIEDDE